MSGKLNNSNEKSVKTKSKPTTNNVSKKSKPEFTVKNVVKTTEPEPSLNNVIKTTEQVKKVIKNKPKPSENKFDDEDDFVEFGKLKKEKDIKSTRGFTNDFICPNEPEPIKKVVISKKKTLEDNF